MEVRVYVSMNFSISKFVFEIVFIIQSPEAVPPVSPCKLVDSDGSILADEYILVSLTVFYKICFIKYVLCPLFLDAIQFAIFGLDFGNL